VKLRSLAVLVVLALALPDLEAQDGAPKPGAPGPPRAGPDPVPPGGPELVGEVEKLRPRPVAPSPARRPRDGERRRLDIPGTTISLPLVAVGGLWWSQTEVSWDAYDVLVFELDRPRAPRTDDGSPPNVPEVPGAPDASDASGTPRAPDAIQRPTRPHMVTDRGWGHAGFPALSISAAGAQAFCTWLASVTGARVRLPTEAEWEAACLAGAPRRADGSAPPWACGEDPAGLPPLAWFRANSERRTHAVATRGAAPSGLHDMHGNVAEWVVARDGGHVLKGGSFRDPSEALAASARQVPVPEWNRSDPNLPRSVWWLADAPFAGFRFVCESLPDERLPDLPGDSR